MRDMLETYDYIVVGGGMAGCLLANRLSQNSDVRVVLLEAGGKDDYIGAHIPAGYFYRHDNLRVDWGFRTAAIDGLGGRSLDYTLGKIFGGGSSINAMIYMRGQAGDYDQWREAGNPGWGWNDVLPYFLRHEDQLALEFDDFDDMHRRGGEWRVEKPRMSWDILDAWAAAAEQAGIAQISDFNRGDNEGSGYFHFNQRAGWRWNTVSAFLKPALDRPNLTVVTHAAVQRLILQEHKVIGVEMLRNRIPMRLGAKREVILAAGSIGSPRLLQLSGIGPGEVLRRCGIEVLCDQPEVGANLQDHLEVRCVYKVAGVKTLNENVQTLWQKAKIVFEYATQRNGPLSMAPSLLGTFTRSDASQDAANLQYHIRPFSLDGLGEAFHKFPAFTAGVCNVRPTSRGYVQITSPNYDVQPEIQPNYLSTEVDCYVAADAIRLTRAIVGQPPLQALTPEEIQPGANIASDDLESLVDAARDGANSLFHPVGTCRMGSDAHAVVDPRLKVNGVDGLRVVDASIMPSIPSGNPGAPTLMIAEKGAAMILEDWKTS